MKRLFLLAAFVLVGVLLAGCQSNSNKTNGISGNITLSGSSALYPLAGQVAQMFMNDNPNAIITVNAGGSGTGLTQVESGAVTIGDSDVFATDLLSATDATGLVDHKVCVVAFAAVVNSDVTGVTSLTSAQLVGIFTGTIKNWSDVGGPDLAIQLVTRPDSSGTKATFDKYALNGATEATGISLQSDSSATVQQTVTQTAGAISYLASSYLYDSANTQGLKVLEFNGVAMTNANVENGSYTIWSYEHMYTKGEATGLAAAFLNYFNTDAVKQQILSMGYVPASIMQVSRTN